MPRERFAQQSLGATHRLVKGSRILLVGAGGIGCELLKNLVLTGFGDIHVVDLDTIDLSNLNRQFLFRQEHIKKPKAIVAKDAAQKFNPNVKLTAHHANIKDAQFDIEWFSSFSLVFNALDNLEARRYVNKMCLAADIPLIESGTTGFNGQVQVIKKGKTACYNCSPKTTPKSYPVCTIRSTPSQPIHCIVWSKSYLLSELFGETEDQTSDLDNTADSENSEEIEKLKQEAQALKKIRESMGSDEFAKQVFDKVFKEDIERLAGMEDIWKDRKKPQPLSYEVLDKSPAQPDFKISETEQQHWSLEENFSVFKDSLLRLSKRLAEEQSTASQKDLPKPIITFDKDDDDTLDFVTATANIRAHIFGIESKSKFETKQMAGNIIPAIATTNAMIAGLCVLQAFKVLKGDYGRTKMIFLDRGNISAGPPDQPNPDCVSCGVAMSRLQIDPERATLKNLVQDILKDKLGYGEELTVMSEQGLIYDPDLEQNLDKKFEELNITDSSFVTIRDEDDDNPRIDLQLAIQAKKLEADSEPVQLIQKEDEKLEIARKPRKKSEVFLDGPTPNGEVTVNGTANAETTGKRKRDLDEGEQGLEAKKLQQDQAKTATGDAKAPITIQEEDGAIVVED